MNVLAREKGSNRNPMASALSDESDQLKRAVGYAQAPLITGALAHFAGEPNPVRVVRHAVRAGNPSQLLGEFER